MLIKHVIGLLCDYFKILLEFTLAFNRFFCWMDKVWREAVVPALLDSQDTGHVTGLLYTLSHMNSSNMKSIPSDVLKTSLPQTWHVPRREKLCGSSADNVIVHGYNVKLPQQPRGLRSTLYNPITSHAPQISDLCCRVSVVDKNCLLLSVVSIDGKGDCEYTSTQFWEISKRIPLSCPTKIVTTLCAKYFRCR